MAWEDDEAEGPKTGWDNDEPVAPVASSPKAWDNDVPLPANHPVARAVRRLRPSVEVTQDAGTLPDAPTSAAPAPAPTEQLDRGHRDWTPDLQDHEVRTPATQFAGVRVEPDRYAEAYMTALARARLPFEQARDLFHKKFGDTYGTIDPKTYAANQAWLANPKNKGYHGNLADISKKTPLTFLEQARNDFAQSAPGALVSHTENAVAAGVPEIAAGQEGADWRQVTDEQHPVASIAGDLIGTGEGVVAGGKTLRGAIGSDAPVIQRGVNVGYGASEGAGMGGPDHRVEGAMMGADMGIAFEGAAPLLDKAMSGIKGRIWGDPNDVHAFDINGDHYGAYPDLATAQEKAPGGVYVKNGDIIAHDIPVDGQGLMPRKGLAQKFFETDIGQKFLKKTASQAEGVPTDVVNPEHEPADGMIRVYHGGSADRPGEWFSTSKTYAQGYADKSDKPQVYYTDLPENDPRISSEYPEQGVKQGFTFNDKLTPEEIKGLKPIERSAEKGGRGLETPANDAGSGKEPPSEPPHGEEPPSDSPPIPEDPEHPVNRLIKLIEAHQKARTETDALRHVEMKERVKAMSQAANMGEGLDTVNAMRGALKGKLPAADVSSITHDLSDEDVTSLANMITGHPAFDVFEKIGAAEGLEKLLGIRSGVATPRELRLLKQVFPHAMVDGLETDPSIGEKILNAGVNVLNVPRALMASMDLSAPGRQGIFLIGTKAYWKAMVPMVKAFGSQKFYDAISDEIASRPSFKLMERSGLALTNVGKNLSEREEQFIGQYAERLPVVGHLVKASDRAYSGFLNKLRADTFDGILKDTKDLGIDVNRNRQAVKDIAKFVNAATGRGDMGSANLAAKNLSTIFFSPRLIASRLQLLAMPFRPSTYLELNPAVRKAYFTNLFKFSGLALTTMGLAKAAGADVEADPRSSDFGKIKIGNTRFDVLGGFQQYIRAGAQIITGERKGADGGMTTLGEGYKADTRFTVLTNLIFNKLAPVPSFVKDVMSGKDAVGQKLDYSPGHLQQNPYWSRLVPLVFQDINDAYQDAGFGRAAAVAPAAIFGIGTQTYQTVGKNHALKGGGKEDPMGDPNDPVVKEVTRLSKDDKKGLITPPSPSIFVDGKQQKLSDADYVRYQKLAAEYIRDDLKKTLASPEYRAMSDEERHDLIKEIVKDQRANARDVIRDSLGQTPKEESGGIIPKAHAAEAPAWANDAPLSIYDFKDGIPTSGHRTPKGNAAVGGATHSDHLDGDGVDYTPAHGQSILELARQARAFFGPSAWIHPEPKKHHVHVSIKGLNAPYIGSRGIQ